MPFLTHWLAARTRTSWNRSLLEPGVQGHWRILQHQLPFTVGSRLIRKILDGELYPIPLTDTELKAIQLDPAFSGSSSLIKRSIPNQFKVAQHTRQKHSSAFMNHYYDIASRIPLHFVYPISRSSRSIISPSSHQNQILILLLARYLAHWKT